MAHCYLAPGIAEAGTGEAVEVTGPEAHHALVARLAVGERVRLTSGEGTLAWAETEAVERSRVQFRLLEVQRLPARQPRTVLVQAVPKSERAELAVAQATEAGVDAIVPWSAERCVSRWKDEGKYHAKWVSWAREAAKQSIRARIPEVHSLTSTAAVGELPAQFLLLDPTATERLSTVALAADSAAVALIVGPEGGITAAERESLVGAGATPVRLGTEVLRTSTAGVAGLSMLNARLGYW